MTNLTPENFSFKFTVLELKIAQDDGKILTINYNEDIKPSCDEGYDTPEEYLENTYWGNIWKEKNLYLTEEEEDKIHNQILLHWRNQLTKDIEFYKEETAQVDLIKNLDIDGFTSQLIYSQITGRGCPKEFKLLTDKLQLAIKTLIKQYIFDCNHLKDEDIIQSNLNKTGELRNKCIQDIKQLLK